MDPIPTHILWDHDGVLVDTEPLYFKATRRALREVGVELSRDRYLAMIAKGFSAWDLARDAGIGEDRVEHHRKRRDAWYQEHLAAGDIDIEGVEAILEELGHGYRMAIVTTSKPADFDLIHANRNVVRHMDFVLKNGDYRREKPAPDPYRAALERFGIGADQAVVVEDSEQGLASAVAAGIRCIVVRSEFTAGQDFRGAWAMIDSLQALPGMLVS
jgi:HAD superfamily hydrolase (TIGR01509 family)